MNVYKELCQHIGGQPEQARRILANRESDTLKTESNNYHSAVIVETTDENINASKKEQIDTPAVEGAAPVNTEEQEHVTIEVDEGASNNTEEVEPLHNDADEEPSVQGYVAPAPNPVAEKKDPSPPKAEKKPA